MHYDKRQSQRSRSGYPAARAGTAGSLPGTYALVGAYHILKGKLFGDPLKRILCIVCAGILFLQMIIYFANARSWLSETAIMYRLMATASDILLFMSLMVYTPYKKA